MLEETYSVLTPDIPEWLDVPYKYKCKYFEFGFCLGPCLASLIKVLPHTSCYCLMLAFSAINVIHLPFLHGYACIQ